MPSQPPCSLGAGRVSGWRGDLRGPVGVILCRLRGSQNASPGREPPAPSGQRGKVAGAGLTAAGGLPDTFAPGLTYAFTPAGPACPAHRIARRTSPDPCPHPGPAALPALHASSFISCFTRTFLLSLFFFLYTFFFFPHGILTLILDAFAITIDLSVLSLFSATAITISQGI